MTHSNLGFELFSPTTQANQALQSLSPEYLTVSEMTDQERQFLNALILDKKPTKVLELGVSAGSSSVILLNALSQIKHSQLYSIDYSTNYYLDNTKLTGYIVDSYPELKKTWKLYTGQLAHCFMDDIGDGIDVCFIDTAHMNPGEILDTLMVLPYMKPGGLVIYHDVNLPTFVHKVTYDINRTLTNNLLISALKGKKILMKDFDWHNDIRTSFPNMAAVELDKQAIDYAYDIINLLTLKWSYLPTPEEEQSLIKFLSQHYPAYLAEYVQHCFNYQRRTFKVSKTSRVKKSLKKATISTIGHQRYEVLIGRTLRN